MGSVNPLRRGVAEATKAQQRLDHPRRRCFEVSRNSSFLEKCMERLQHDSESEKENSCPPTPSRVGSGLDEPAMMKLIQSAVTQAIAANCRTASPAGSSTVSTSSTEMVDIGHNVLIPNHIHTMALATASPTRMTSMLLQGAYTSDKHLIGKSYAGQKKTIAGKVYQKPGVKKRRKIIAIQNLVFKKYPTFSRSSFGQTINNYISKLSIPSKRQLSEEDLEDDTDDELLS